MKILTMITGLMILNIGHATDAIFQSTQKNGNITFETIAKPVSLKIKGEGDAPKSTLTISEAASSLESTVDLEQLKTGNGMRDDHMKDYLETKKYPQAKLTIKTLKIPATWEKEPTPIKDQEFSGILNLHGKDVPAQGTFSLNADRVANAEFKIKLTDYGIEVPNYLGMTVNETITIKTQIQFEKK